MSAVWSSPNFYSYKAVALSLWDCNKSLEEILKADTVLYPWDFWGQNILSVNDLHRQR